MKASSIIIIINQEDEPVLMARGAPARGKGPGGVGEGGGVVLVLLVIHIFTAI